MPKTTKMKRCECGRRYSPLKGPACTMRACDRCRALDGRGTFEFELIQGLREFGGVATMAQIRAHLDIDLKRPGSAERHLWRVIASLLERGRITIRIEDEEPWNVDRLGRPILNGTQRLVYLV